MPFEEIFYWIYIAAYGECKTFSYEALEAEAVVDLMVTIHKYFCF